MEAVADGVDIVPDITSSTVSHSGTQVALVPVVLLCCCALNQFIHSFCC